MKPRHGAFSAAYLLAIAIKKNGGGQAAYAQRLERGDAIIAVGLDACELVFCKKFFNAADIVFHGNRHNMYAFAFVVFDGLVNFRQLVDAGHAPGCPKMNGSELVRRKISACDAIIRYPVANSRFIVRARSMACQNKQNASTNH